MRSRSSIALYWGAWWLASMAVWLLLTSTVSLNEVITGFGAATVAATAAAAAHRRHGLPVRVSLRDLGVVWRIPWCVAADTWLLIRALGRRISGQEVHGGFREVSWAPPPGERERHGMEAFGTVVTTISPNHIVVGFDLDSRTVLVHELLPRTPTTLEEVMRVP